MPEHSALVTQLNSAPPVCVSYPTAVISRLHKPLQQYQVQQLRVGALLASGKPQNLHIPGQTQSWMTAAAAPAQPVCGPLFDVYLKRKMLLCGLRLYSSRRGLSQSCWLGVGVKTFVERQKFMRWRSDERRCRASRVKMVSFR